MVVDVNTESEQLIVCELNENDSTNADVALEVIPVGDNKLESELTPRRFCSH